MTEMAQRQELEQAVPLAALFTAFLAVSLYGVGGGSGIVWARRIAVENRRWISDRKFADIVSLCQCPGRTSSELRCASEQRCGARSERSPQFPAFLSSREQSAFRLACCSLNMLTCRSSRTSSAELPRPQPGC